MINTFKFNIIIFLLISLSTNLKSQNKENAVETIKSNITLDNEAVPTHGEKSISGKVLEMKGY